MLGSKASRAKYISMIIADPQRPFIWEYFRPGTIPLPGERAYYDEVTPHDLDQFNNLQVSGRNEGGHSNLSQFSVHFLFTSAPTGFKRISRPLILVRNFVRLVH
jgi:hypothetical protein